MFRLTARRPFRARWGVLPALFAAALLIAPPIPATASPTTGWLDVYVNDGGGPVAHAQVSIENVKKAGAYGSRWTDFTGLDGRVGFRGVEPGWYVVSTYHDHRFLYGESDLRADTSKAIYLPAGDARAFTVSFPANGTVTGRVLTDPATAPGSRHWTVTAYAADDYGRLTEVASTSSSIHHDTFEILDVPAGEIFLRAAPDESDVERYDPTWAESSRSWWGAEPVTVRGSETTSGIDLTLPAATSTDVERLGGADRFEMAANVSMSAVADADIGDGVPVVFVASGLNFPDALSAGPVAAAYGPLLLTTPSELPTPTRLELERLNPERIVIVGGPNSVGAAVEGELAALTSEVTRISGPDRYAVSRDLARFGFPDGAEVAVLATGANFPDALAAGSYAGSMGAPVVLLNGPTGVVDAATMTLLDDLGVRSILVVGGPNSVPESMIAQFVADDSIQILKRVTGDDRYMAAAGIPSFHEVPDQYFLANGSGFADALAGSWYAARLGAPILLTQRDCIPRYFPDRTMRSSVTVLGGPNSISERVASDFPVC